MKKNESIPYKTLCAKYYELDKPTAPEEALACYLTYAKKAQGMILEPMCGSGRYLIPLAEKGFKIVGFDYSTHMIAICRKKCEQRKLKAELFEATFETFIPQEQYALIFIPSGSFCLLTSQEQTSAALQSISSWLAPKGKFVFEVETIKAVSKQQGIWKGSYIEQPDGSLLVLNTLSKYDEAARVETILCRYELWENNKISCTEVENFRLRLYEQSEIEHLLNQNGFRVVSKWQAEPFKRCEPDVDASVILYECEKKTL